MIDQIIGLDPASIAGVTGCPGQPPQRSTDSGAPPAGTAGQPNKRSVRIKLFVRKVSLTVESPY
jgi:hypothetical protein